MPSVPISRAIDVKFEVSWQGSADTYVDETARLVSARGALEIVPTNEIMQGGRQIIQKASVVLNNTDYRYSPYNTTGPLYAYISTGAYYLKPARLWVQIDGGAWQSVFKGYVKLPEESYGSAQVTLTLFDLCELLRKRYSTGILRDYLEHDLVIHYLKDVAGLIDGTHFVSPSWAASHPGTSATIAVSNTKVPFSWLDDEAIWDELVEIGQASGGRIYVDASGFIHFDKGWSWFVNQGAAETITISRTADLQPKYRDVDFYDEVVVEYSPRTVGGRMIVFTHDSQFYVYPGDEDELILKFQWPVYLLDAIVPGTTFQVLGPNGTNLLPYVNVTVESYAQQAKIKINNTSSEIVHIPRFDLYGTPLVGAPTNQVKRQINPAATSGRRLEVRGNPYIQDKSQAAQVANFLQWWHKTRKLSYTVSRLRGNPARALGKQLRVMDGSTVIDSFLDRTGIITKIDFTIQVNPETRTVRFEQTIDVLENAFLNAGDLFFIVGTHSWGAADKVLWH